MMGALSLTCLLLTVFPFATYALPALASVWLFPVVIECGKRYGAAVYAATAILALLIAPDMEAKVLYVAFFGYYPLIKSVAESCSAVTEWILKLAVFNGAVVATYAALVGFMGLPLEDFTMAGVPLPVALAILLVLGNGVFVLYDVALTRLLPLYFARFRPLLRRLFK
jgi:hypothetical protein